MRTCPRRFAATLMFGALGLLGAPLFGADGPYHFIREIPIGGEGGWDYLSLDPGARRLYVSHGTKVVVIDVDRDAIVGEIADTPGVHGVALAPELDRGLASDGGENQAAIVDLKTLRILTKVDTDRGPDSMLFEPGRQEFYTFNGRADSATVISAKSNAVVATIPLGGRPEFATADAAAGRVYDNLENKSLVAVIDAATHAVVARWPIAPGESASGMAIDPAHHRLFIGCHNKLMVMMDATTGKVLATVPIGQGVDANAFDPGTQFAFASCGDGTVTIAKEETPDSLTLVQTLPTERGARTMALDVKTHRIYLATAKFGPEPEATPGERRRRPPMIPGSFKILVYGME
jgi:YVTN family beta-propeller protein